MQMPVSGCTGFSTCMREGILRKETAYEDQLIVLLSSPQQDRRKCKKDTSKDE